MHLLHAQWICASPQLPATPGAQAVQAVQWTCVNLCVGVSVIVYFALLLFHPVTAGKPRPTTLAISTVIPK